MLLPGFWLAVTTYHQEQLPYLLLATVVESRTGLPFPTILEIMMMLFMFEMFREANLRLPSAISGSISVVGGLIIGDAAIKAGVTSPSMIVIIAISSIAAFTLVNQAFVTAMSIFRLIIILFSAFLGLFGFLFRSFSLLSMQQICVYSVCPILILMQILNRVILENPYCVYRRRAIV